MGRTTVQRYNNPRSSAPTRSFCSNVLSLSPAPSIMSLGDVSMYVEVIALICSQTPYEQSSTSPPKYSSMATPTQEHLGHLPSSSDASEMWDASVARVADFAKRVENWAEDMGSLITDFDFVPNFCAEVQPPASIGTAEPDTSGMHTSIAPGKIPTMRFSNRGRTGARTTADLSSPSSSPRLFDDTESEAYTPLDVENREHTLFSLLEEQKNEAEAFVKIRENPPRMMAGTLTSTAATLSLGGRALAQYWQYRQGSTSSRSKRIMSSLKAHREQSCGVLAGKYTSKPPCGSVFMICSISQLCRQPTRNDRQRFIHVQR